jgi:hypothetical protein
VSGRIKEPGPERAPPRPRDLTGSNRLAELCGAFVRAKAAEAARREILELVGERSARAAGYLVTVERTAAVPERTITAEMVGKVISGRAAGLRLKVSPAIPAARAA